MASNLPNKPTVQNMLDDKTPNAANQPVQQNSQISNDRRLLFKQIIEQIQKNPALIQCFKVINQQVSTQPQIPPIKSPPKKKPPRPPSAPPPADTKIAHSRSWELPVKMKEPPAKSFYEKRQHIIVDPSQIKRIHTPDWVLHDSNSQNPSTSPKQIENNPITDFDQVASHFRLEVYESRIINGIEKRFQHPANAINASDLDGELELTPTEEKKLQNYEKVDIKQPIPYFWPQRVWDSQEPQMTQTLNNILFSDVQKITQITSSLTFFHSKSAPSSPKLRRSNSARIPRHKTHKKSKDILLNISFNNYLTDDSEFTDLEDF